jgi:DNA-binding IclR family transcriptional regulator
MEALKEARQRGYAVNREELFLGDMTIAAPIVSATGRPLGAVHLVAPTGRWSLEEMEAKLGPPLLQCARAISSSVRALG